MSIKNKKIGSIAGAVIIVLILVVILGDKMGWLGGGYIKYHYDYPVKESGARYYHTSGTNSQGEPNYDNKGYKGTYTSAAESSMDKILGIKNVPQPAINVTPVNVVQPSDVIHTQIKTGSSANTSTGTAKSSRVRYTE
jgi:hypothetical protein